MYNHRKCQKKKCSKKKSVMRMSMGNGNKIQNMWVCVCEDDGWTDGWMCGIYINKCGAEDTDER